MAQRMIPCPICGQTNNFYTLITARGNRGVPFIAPTHPVVLCRQCGVCFLNPQHDESDYVRFYADYDRPHGKTVARADHRAQGLSGEYDRLRLDFFERFVLNKNGSIVDIGSGYGRFLDRLRERGYTTLAGIEPSDEAVAVSRANFPFPVQHAGLGDADLPQDTFDAALLIAVVEHFTDPVAALSHVYSILKPGGLFYINTPDLRGFAVRHGLGKDKFFKFVHTFYFTETSLKNCLRKAGFEIAGSYNLPPDLRYSTLLAPDNFALGELNVMARRPAGGTVAPAIEREDWRELAGFVSCRIREDRPYRLAARTFEILRHRPIIGGLVRRFQKQQRARLPRPLADRDISPLR
jgi:SAM-dependent methyltransferase